MLNCTVISNGVFAPKTKVELRKLIAKAIAAKISCIVYVHFDHHDFVSEYFPKEEYRESYNRSSVTGRII